MGVDVATIVSVTELGDMGVDVAAIVSVKLLHGSGSCCHG